MTAAARFATVALAASGLALPLAAAAPAAHAATTNPPALWYKTSGSPTDAEITAAASRYRVVILNPWEKTALHKLKALNPSIVVLAYKCLSSTRSYSGAVINGQDAAVLPAGVGYVEANTQHPEWFALDTNGARVQWGSYAGHWQMAVWNAGYQQRWADNVASEIGADSWDGVLADNALTRMRSSYFGGTLAGAPTKEALQAGERGLIAAAAAKLHAVGKILVPNISEARLYPGLWNDWAVNLADGGMEENYAHWGTDPNDVGSYLYDWGSNGWTAVQAQMSSPGLNLAVTRSVDTDSRSYLYGLASFWVAGGTGAFEAVDDYRKAPFRTEQAWNLGTATGAVGRAGAAYTRTFSAGFAAVNPSSTASATVAVPAGMVNASSQPVSSVTLGPLTGAIFRGTATSPEPSTSPSPSPTSSPNGKKWRHHSPGMLSAFGGVTSTLSGTTATASATATSPRAVPTPRAVRLAEQHELVPSPTPAAPGTAGPAATSRTSRSTAHVTALNAEPAANPKPLRPPLPLVPLVLGFVVASGAALIRRVYVRI